MTGRGRSSLLAFLVFTLVAASARAQVEQGAITGRVVDEVTNGLSAEYGRTGGGIITAATRSGTNTLHGSAYAYIRNDRFNANSWTNKRNNVPRGKEDIKQWGFTLGGPVEKNRTFFFVNLERSKSLTPDNLIRTVPTLLQRAGDFSQTRTSSGQLIVIYDPRRRAPTRQAASSATLFPGA
jgi:hypothetical protein